MMARMSCLITMAQMYNDTEVSQLIDIVNEYKISKKYLIIFMETLNATLLREKTINFNVIVYHNEPGESVCGVQVCIIAIIDNIIIWLFGRWNWSHHILVSQIGENVC